MIDPKRGHIIRQMFEKVGNEGWSGRRLHFWLKEDLRFKGKCGTFLALSHVYKLLRNPFYYGTFEYPRNSGNWYQGKHQPLITKELFDRVQAKLNVERQQKGAYGEKEFLFTKLILCGECGSGITAEEKMKNLQGGGVNRHVYYRCTKTKNVLCKNPAINEKELIEAAQDLMDKVDLDRISIKEKLEQELERFNWFQAEVLGTEVNEAIKPKKLDIRNYVKYLLRKGTNSEKREILFCLKSKLILKDRKLIIE